MTGARLIQVTDSGNVTDARSQWEPGLVSRCSEFPCGGNAGGCFPGPEALTGKVSEPPAIWLFGIGPAGLVGFTKRRKAA